MDFLTYTMAMDSHPYKLSTFNVAHTFARPDTQNTFRF